MALFLSVMSGFSPGLSGFSSRGLSTLNCAVACAFKNDVMLTSSRLSLSDDMSPSTTLPPRSAAMVSK
jgi:hypothetical protein